MKIRAYTKDNERLNERQSARVFFFTAPPSTHVRSLCVGEPDSRSTGRRFCNFRLLHSTLQGISERMAGEEHEHFRAGELAADAFCDDADRRALHLDFLIPMRIVMWSVGTTYFVAGETVEKKKRIKNVLTHPCLVAIYLGLLCMVTQVQLPSVILNTVKYIGNCNSALTMFIVGTILTDAPLKSIVSRDTVKFSLLRLALLPAAALGVGLLLHLEPTALGVSVLMTGMPAGATAAIFAAKYGSDAPFAARNVVFTTLLSMLTLPLWAYAVG